MFCDFDFITKNNEPIAMVDFTDFLNLDKNVFSGKITVFIGKAMSKDDILELFQDALGSFNFWKE